MIHFGSRARAVVAAFTITFAIQLLGSSVLAGAFLDERLQAWQSVKGNSSLVSDHKDVIVFMKAPQFKDRSQLMKSQAIAEERSDMTNYLKMEAIRLVPSQGMMTGGSTAEVLWSSRAILASLDRATLLRLSQDSNVDAIIENAIITLEKPMKANTKNKTDESKMTYGLQKINAETAWNQNITGEGVVVGVIDTGCDAEHPDLKGKILLQKDFTNDNDNKDYHGHGTHVSGTILGGKASGRAIGVAPGAKIIMAKVFNSQGQASTAEILKAMEWIMDPDGNPATNDAPRLVSNSWGGSQWDYGFRNIVQTWRRFDIFPNFAAGNSGYFFTVGAPGSYPFSYAVGAVDEDYAITSFSSRGPSVEFSNYWVHFHTKPEISAPGFNVYSSIPNGQWEYYSGTSMATPHISGVLALALQANPNLHVEDLENLLNSTAMARGKAPKNNRYGHGVVQVDKVIEKAKTWQTTSGTHLSFFRDRDPSQWAWATP